MGFLDFLSEQPQGKKSTEKCPLDYRGEDRCQDCIFLRNSQCRYRAVKQRENPNRGFAVLTTMKAIEGGKWGDVELGAQTVTRVEAAAIANSLPSEWEQKQYLVVSMGYRAEWAKADSKKRAELKSRMEDWRRYLEMGFSPKEAQEIAAKRQYPARTDPDSQS